MIDQEAMRSKCFRSHWRVIILFMATAFVQDGTSRGSSQALIWSTKSTADGVGSMFFVYGDPNSYRDQLEQNETISSTDSVSERTNSSNFMALETDFVQSKLYYSGYDGYLYFGAVNVSQKPYEIYYLSVPAVSKLVTGLSIDWISNLIYSSDAIYQRICVVDANTYRIWRPVVESGLSSPQDVAVYPQKGILFWTDSSPKIERLDLANNTRQVLVTNDSLIRPTTLVIDFVNQRLLWLDSAASRIGFVNFNGSGLSFWSMELFSSISSFVIFKEYVFLGDKSRPRSYAYNFTEKTFVGYVTAKDTSGVIDMTAYAPEKQPSFTSPCRLENGGCNHFCITKSSTESVCQCAMGFFMDPNGTTCYLALLEDNFLIVSDPYQFNIFQIDLGNGEVRAAYAAVTDRIDITAMDYDPVSRTVYGFDSDKQLIRKVTLDDHSISTVLELQSTEISSLVVDEVGQTLYFVNHDQGNIMRASLSGDDPRTIISTDDGTLATAIALDVQNRLMFWSDCSDRRRSIERASISNPSIHHTVVKIFGFCASAVAVDFSNQVIYWADNTGRIEQVGYNGTGRLLIRQLPSTSLIRGLTVDRNFVYISNSMQRQIQRINRSSHELTNLTGIRFSKPYAISLFRPATTIPITSSTTPNTTFGLSFDNGKKNNNTSDSGSLTTIIVPPVVIGTVVLAVVAVTIGIVLSKKYRRSVSVRQSGVYETSLPSVYDTINYTSMQNGSTLLTPVVEIRKDNSQVQDNRSERLSDSASGNYELSNDYVDTMRYTQLSSQLKPEDCQQSTNYALHEKPSEPPPAYEPTEIHNDYL